MGDSLHRHQRIIKSRNLKWLRLFHFWRVRIGAGSSKELTASLLTLRPLFRFIYEPTLLTKIKNTCMEQCIYIGLGLSWALAPPCK
jgi:hypothetical protein